ncbi:hypothetical protein [Streptomyces sp. NBC_01190]|uniref:hypothetical protein n=1 Tax=Streptomyces sp. NBC_01190 TaxID=2903767 RepID=UPI0038675150|nr:hypothetical protein OG519_18155 [Streptomyces sp. NBC_01190]
MTYVVTVDTEIPVGASELDPLQREGVINLLDKHLDALEAVEGPDGVKVDVFERVIAVHPGGALLKIFVDAPALEFAEDAVHAAMTDVLERSELLADWTITRCQVELHPDLAQRSLDAADGPDAPPDDPAERTGRHGASGPVPLADADVADAADDVADADDADDEGMRRMLRALAPRLKAFPLAAFGCAGPEGDDAGRSPVGREAAETAAGALVHAIDLLVDELFSDLARLERDGPDVGESAAPFMLLDELPEQYVHHYDVGFVRRLITTAVTMTGRLVQPHFGQLTCVAEELLMRLLVAQAEVTAELHGLHGEELTSALRIFVEHVYEDMGHQWLYEPPPDEPDEDPALAHLDLAPMDIEDWFTPSHTDRHVHPYARHPTPGEDPHPDIRD